MKQAIYFDGAKKISLTTLENIVPGQDGAIFDGKIFRVTSDGDDIQTPERAGFSFTQVTAEEYLLPEVPK